VIKPDITFKDTVDNSRISIMEKEIQTESAHGVKLINTFNKGNVFAKEIRKTSKYYATLELRLRETAESKEAFDVISIQSILSKAVV